MSHPPKTLRATKQPARPDAVAFLDDLFGYEADWEPLVERARMNRDVAHAIYDLRTAHGLTQHQLAVLIGTRQPVIARLEDADYEGHSLTTLSRIAAALHQRVKVEFVPRAGLPPRKQGTPRRTVRGQAGSHVADVTRLRLAASATPPARKKSAARATSRPAEAHGVSTKATAKTRSARGRPAAAGSTRNTRAR